MAERMYFSSILRGGFIYIWLEHSSNTSIINLNISSTLFISLFL